MTIKINDITLSDQTEICNEFNNFFVNIGPSLGNKMKQSNQSHLDYLKGNYSKNFFISPTDSEEVYDFIKLLDPKRHQVYLEFQSVY